MAELPHLTLNDPDLEEFRNHAQQMRRNARQEVWQAEADFAYWSTEPVEEEENPAKAQERKNMLAAAAQRQANAMNRWNYWESRVTGIPTKKDEKAKPAAKMASE